VCAHKIISYARKIMHTAGDKSTQLIRNVGGRTKGELLREQEERGSKREFAEDVRPTVL